ncbi:MAG: peptidase MA family protein [Leptospira sp.]|nr:peptidase MA family protein [Leptospira sp.]
MFQRVQFLANLSISLLILAFTNVCNPYLFSPQKKNGLRPLATSLILLGASCQTTNAFWARNLTTQASECITFNPIASGKNVQVYLESGLSVGSFDLVRFTNDFDTITYPKLVDAFGPPSDVDGDGKIKVLVLDVRDGATPNSAYVAGFYDPVNFFPDQFGSRVRSNFAEILYMDGRELIRSLSRDPSGFDATAAHEFQHLIRFPNMNRLGQTDDIWINEGTSEVASDLAGYGPQTSRINCYLGRDDRCADGINGISMIDWSRNSSSNEILKKYAYAYVYMRFLYDISGSNESARTNFFRQTVVGNSANTRAVRVNGLMTLFRESSGYNSTFLGSSNNEVFFRTFSLLMGRTYGIDFSAATMQRIPESGGSAITFTDMPQISAAYPFSSALSSIPATEILPTANKTILTTSSGNFYSENTQNIPPNGITSNRARIFLPGSNNKGVLYWGASPEFISSLPTTSIRSTEQTTEWEIPIETILEEETQANKLKADLTKRLRSDIPLPVNSNPHGICGFEFTNVPGQTVESIPIK